MRLDLPQAVRETESLLLKARGELSAALRERDVVNADLTERRRALSEVSQAVYSRTGDYADALKFIKATEQERDSTRIKFYKEIDQRISLLDKFKDLDKAHSEIISRIEGLQRQEEALRSNLSKTSALLLEARTSLVEAKTEESAIRESVAKESQRLNAQEESYKSRVSIVEKRETILDKSFKELERSKDRLKNYAETLGIKINYVENDVKPA
jgi:chaperonin cofactor prefoldin